MTLYELFDVCESLGIEPIIESCIGEHAWFCDCPTGESTIQTYCAICYAKNPKTYTFLEWADKGSYYYYLSENKGSIHSDIISEDPLIVVDINTDGDTAGIEYIEN